MICSVRFLQMPIHRYLLLLRHLGSIDRPMRLLVLATYRDNEAAALLE
jgi:hypothetical protein